MLFIKLINKFTLLLCVILSYSAYSNQTIYQWQSSDGELHFSDQPHPGAKKIEIQEAKPYQPLKIKKTKPFKKEIKKINYERFEVQSPTNNETIRNGTGQIIITLKVTPKLMEDHYFLYVMDDKEVGSLQKKNTLKLSNIDRGSHVIKAQLVDSNKNIIATTQSITVYMHRPFNQNPKVDQSVKIINKTYLFPKTQKVISSN